MEPGKLLAPPPVRQKQGLLFLPLSRPLNSVIWGLRRLLGVLNLGGEHSFHFPFSLSKATSQSQSDKPKEPFNFLDWYLKIPRNGIYAVMGRLYF